MLIGKFIDFGYKVNVRNCISPMVILAASITTAEAVQFHKIEFYKQTFSKLSSEDQNSGGLHFSLSMSKIIN